MDKETKEEVRGGVVLATLLFTLFILVVLGFAPLSVLFGKWNDYWTTPAPSLSTTTDQWNAYDKADKDCQIRAKAYLGSNKVATYASSTDGEIYKTYDCYGVKLNKIPN